MSNYTDAEFAAAMEAMRAAGRKSGTAAGGWIADGNTSEESLRITLQQWEDGDPAPPSAPSPFSGEWADSPTVEEVINSETDLNSDELEPEEIDELARAFEDEFSMAWQEEAERTVRALLPDSEE